MGVRVTTPFNQSGFASAGAEWQAPETGWGGLTLMNRCHCCNQWTFECCCNQWMPIRSWNGISAMRRHRFQVLLLIDCKTLTCGQSGRKRHTPEGTWVVLLESSSILPPPSKKKLNLLSRLPRRSWPCSIVRLLLQRTGSLSVFWFHIFTLLTSDRRWQRQQRILGAGPYWLPPSGLAERIRAVWHGMKRDERPVGYLQSHRFSCSCFTSSLDLSHTVT